MNVVLRTNRNLSRYNYGNISDRLEKATGGRMFVAYNGFNGRYEVHSITSFFLDKGESLQVSFESQKFLNDWLIRDIKANDLRKYLLEVKGTREYLENLFEQAETEREGKWIEHKLRNLESLLGRRI